MKRAALSLLLALTTAAPARAAASCQSINLKQGWDPPTAEKFWFTSQGSRIMPYAWFMALEVPDPSSQVLFSVNLQRYGYIPAAKSTLNPGGLPIGFVKDTDKGKNKREYIGLTCAACHTGSITIGGQSATVEGGQALADFWSFLSDTVDALTAATTNEAKRNRFVKRVQDNGNPPPVLKDMQATLNDLQTRRDQNKPTNAFGNGRVDAFGHIFTRVLAQDLKIPENAKPPYAPVDAAPVSYPVLWDTPQHDVVQWNGSAPNTEFLDLGSLGRNIGEVLGVFGTLDVKKRVLLPPKFTSSVQARINDLVQLESTVKSLWSPLLPVECLPKPPDPDTVSRGQGVYKKACETCHTTINRTDSKRRIVATLVPVPSVMTDPTMAENFAHRRAKTGALEGQPNSVGLLQSVLSNGGWKNIDLKNLIFGADAIGPELLVAIVNGVLLDAGRPLSIEQLRDSFKPIDFDRMKKAFNAVQEPSYKARPLNGIWASAPYLHNGSVPTLSALLNPAERPKTFYVGSREFDPDNVGLKTDNVPGAFLFDTSKPGNSSSGHPYGTDLSADEKKVLLEYLKTI